MIINDIFAQFDIESNIGNDCSVSNSYDRVIDLASRVFANDEFSDSEKKALYIELCSIYNQCDKQG